MNKNSTFSNTMSQIFSPPQRGLTLLGYIYRFISNFKTQYLKKNKIKFLENTLKNLMLTCPSNVANHLSFPLNPGATVSGMRCSYYDLK